MTDTLPMTLGKFICLLRTKHYVQRTGDRKLTQAELGRQLGYNRGVINRWENNRQVPKPDDVMRLAKVTCASAEDIHYMLGLAGYLPKTRFPKREVTLNILSHVAECLAQSPYPAYVLDYRGRFWIVNQAIAEAIGIPLNALKALMLPHPAENNPPEPIDVLSVLLDSRLPFQALLGNRDQLIRRQIARFKAINLYRRHEPFYQQCLARLEKRLLPDDFRLLAQFWREADPFEVPRSSACLHSEIAIVRGGEQRLYSLHDEPIFELATLFFQVRYVPYDGLLLPRPAERTAVLRLWDVVDDFAQVFADEFSA
jgi:transcriptional regulator with XRE-family HTH domain